MDSSRHIRHTGAMRARPDAGPRWRRPAAGSRQSRTATAGVLERGSVAHQTRTKEARNLGWVTSTDLERRRLAIAEALRAVMAEPLPTEPAEPLNGNGWATYPQSPVLAHPAASGTPDVPTSTPEPEEPVAAFEADVDVEEVSFLDTESSREDAAEDDEPVHRLSLREALMAYIDWDDDEAVVAPTAGAAPATNGVRLAAVPDEAMSPPDDDAPAATGHDGHALIDAHDDAAPEFGDVEDDADEDGPASPTVPPVENVASMSRAASMALFGHA